MHFHDAGRLGEIQCVEAPIDEDAFGVQHRAHRAVADEHTFVDRLEKWLHTERNDEVIISLLNLLVFQRGGVDEQIRPVDPVDADRPHSLAILPRIGDGVRTSAVAASRPRAAR